MSKLSKPFSVAEIREAFLAFFAEKNCVRYPSASLVPENDPTTLFTVAGMSQFKDMFLGRGTHPFSRATTVQKCIRTNDIMNVGRTARHHTFFEMLGNFSFNDYFKREAIHWAWEFLTQRLQLDASRLSVSVHTIDDEAYRIWRDEVGVPAERIFRMGDNDNFWPANAPKEGPEGPGGCCSEIFWDHRTNNDPNDNLMSNTGRFVEIWNLVFPQFNVRKPHADGSPNLEQLGRANIDTGSGLERVAAVMQGVYNNFDIDVFQTIIKDVCAISGKEYDKQAVLGAKTQAAENNALIRRIADHVRAVTFCIADGALPGNSDRGYIVRRLIRRATLDLDKLGVDEAKLFEVVPSVIAAMGQAYPEIIRRQDLARDTLKAEEQLFRRTLRKGMDLFQRSLDKYKGGKVFSGDDAFELVTTHGFPKEIIAELAGAENLTIDEKQFTARWDEHTRISNTKQIEVFTSTALQEAKPRLGVTPFVGYEQLAIDSDITLLELSGKEVASAATGSDVRFALKTTPFYAESGGQVGDRGTVSGDGFTIAVSDTQKDEGLVVHLGKVTVGTARPGKVCVAVDEKLRAATVRHHSATHLLHSALGRVLGDHIEQQGSKVEPAALRFDFNHPQALTREQIAAVEKWVNEVIGKQHPVDIRTMSLDEAKKLGAKAQFGEKYGAMVRVVTMGTGEVSREFCGGCHVKNTGDIASLRILSEGASSAGIRRIVAVAGDEAARLAAEEMRLAQACGAFVQLGTPTHADARQVDDLAKLFKAPLADVPQRVQQLADDVRTLAARLNEKSIALSGSLSERVVALQEEAKRLRKRDEARQAQAAAGAADDLVQRIQVIGIIPVLVAEIPGYDGKALRTLLDAVRSKKSTLCAVLVSIADGKVSLMASVSNDLTASGLHAGNIIAKLAPLVGGRGGGKADMAQAGGSDTAAVPMALDAARRLITETINTGANGASKGM
jgi:alanyl-tRNA synthetase